MKKCIGLFASILTFATFSLTAFAEGDIVQTLASDDNIVVELVSIEGDTASGYTWNLHVENKTDKDINTVIEGAIVNGLALDPHWIEQVPAGESSDSQVIWTPGTFQEVDMTGDITEVRFVLRAYDLTEYNTFLQEDLCVRPDGDDVVYYERTPLDTDQVIFSTDDYEMCLIDFEVNDWEEFQINAYLVNNTDKTLLFQGENWKINGTTDCDPFWAAVLLPHSSAYNQIAWTHWSLQDTGITAFESIDCDLNVMDFDTWDTLDKTALSLTLSDPVPVSGGDIIPSSGDQPAPQPRKNLVIDSVQNVKESGAEGKTWRGLFNQ